MNSTMCWRPDIVCKLEFIDKFNIEVSYQNLENDFSFQNVHPSLFMTTPLILFFSDPPRFIDFCVSSMYSVFTQITTTLPLLIIGRKL